MEYPGLPAWPSEAHAPERMSNTDLINWIWEELKTALSSYLNDASMLNLKIEARVSDLADAGDAEVLLAHVIKPWPAFAEINPPIKSTDLIGKATFEAVVAHIAARLLGGKS